MNQILPLRRAASGWWTGYLAALAGVVVVTALLGVVFHQNQLGNASLLYLVVVLGIAVRFGSGPAVFAGVVALLTFDWFFVGTPNSFAVGTVDQWGTLLLFLITAIITGQLAAAEHERAREARLREREAVVLYDVARLMSDPDLERALHAVASRLGEELALAAVAVDLQIEGMAIQAEVGDPPALAIVRQRQELPLFALSGGPTSPGGNGLGGRPGPGRWIRVVPSVRPARQRPSPAHTLYDVPVNLGGKRIGTLFLVRPLGATPLGEGDTRLLAAMSVQLGLAVERTRLRQEATEAEILRRSDDLKTSLLHAVSHDLRTPLATIMASAGSLRQRGADWSEEERDDFARTIEDEARRLNRIVENLLDLSRIQAGALQPQLAWYDLRTVVDDVAARLQARLRKRRLTIDVPEDLPPVQLDPVFVDQILSNLIENAAKYTPPATEIQVGGKVVDDEVWIEVGDRGPGVPTEVLDRLFEPFYQVQGNRLRARRQGLGIGLAVTRGLVLAQGGRVWAINRPEGGLSVTFALPLAPAPVLSTEGEG